jgi:hypothetical protein
MTMLLVWKSELRSVMGATEDEIESLSRKAIALERRGSHSPADIRRTMMTMACAGDDVLQIHEFIAEVLRGARGLGVDPGEFAQAVYSLKLRKG